MSAQVNFQYIRLFKNLNGYEIAFKSTINDFINILSWLNSSSDSSTLRPPL